MKGREIDRQLEETEREERMKRREIDRQLEET